MDSVDIAVVVIIGTLFATFVASGVVALIDLIVGRNNDGACRANCFDTWRRDSWSKAAADDWYVECIKRCEAQR